MRALPEINQALGEMREKGVPPEAGAAQFHKENVAMPAWTLDILVGVG